MKLDPNPHKTSAESASLLSYRGGGGDKDSPHFALQVGAGSLEGDGTGRQVLRLVHQQLQLLTPLNQVVYEKTDSHLMIADYLLLPVLFLLEW